MTHDEFFARIFNSDKLASLIEEQPSSREWLRLIYNSLQPQTYSKGNIIHNIGKVPQDIYFLIKGVARAYFSNANGHSITFYLWDKFAIVTDINSYNLLSPSDLRTEICTDSELLVLSRTDLNRITNQYPEAHQFFIAMLTQFIQHHRERDMDMLTLNATERTEKFMRENPQADHKFAQQWMASYLGLTASHYHVVKKSLK